MKQRLAGLSLCALALLASACQPRTKTRVITVTVPATSMPGDTELVNFVKQTFGSPLLSVSGNAECADRNEGQALQSEAVQGVWYGYQDLDEQSVAVTTKVLNGGIFERELTNKTDLRYTIQSDKKELKLCGEAIIPQSIEDIGTQLKQAVDRSATFYSKVRLSLPELNLPLMPQLGIGVEPQYTKDVKRLDQILKLNGTKTQTATQTVTTQTDNAFYSPFGDETLSPSIYSISVIPQSLEAKQDGLYNGKALWEFPVVFHHEYGHHIFQMLFGDSTVLSYVNYLDYWSRNRNLHAIHGSLAGLNQDEDLAQKQERIGFLSGSGYVFSSMNEGFADLFAYYSLGETKGLFDISCFAQTREVSAAIMYGGIAKVWNEELWNETFDISKSIDADLDANKSSKTPIEICSTPSFDDIHIMGAVIAHTVDAAFDIVAQSRPNQASALLKAGLLMQWIQELRASDEVLELSSKHSLSRVLNSALGTSLKALQGQNPEALCAVVASKFPYMLKRWQDKSFEDEAGILKTCTAP